MKSFVALWIASTNSVEEADCASLSMNKIVRETVFTLLEGNTNYYDKIGIPMGRRRLPGESSLERIQESDIGDDLTSKLRYILRLKFQSLPHPSRFPAEGFEVGI
jgi:hypothetical protein